MNLLEWQRMAGDVLHNMRHAQNHLQDPVDLEEAHDFVSMAYEILRELDHQLGMRDADDEWREKWARTWFHEATLLHAFADSLTDEPVLVDGAYRWRIRSVSRPPLKVPEEDHENRDGPRLEIEVGCNTTSVFLIVNCDSMYNTHVDGS